MILHLPETYTLLLSMTIEGQLPRKSNARRVVSRGRGGPPMVIKSQEALDYIDSVAKTVTGDQKLKLGSLSQPLLIVANVFYTTRRPDLSIELLLDALEQADVLKNDRYVRQQIIGGYVDADRPRTELCLFSVDRHNPIMIGGRSDVSARLVHE